MHRSSRTIEQVLDDCRSATLYPEGSPRAIDQRDVFGDTPLHLTARWGDAEAVALLITAGADVNAVGEKGQTPLFAAANVEIATLLTKAGASSSIRDDDALTPEQFLRMVNRVDVADYLRRTSRR